MNKLMLAASADSKLAGFGEEVTDLIIVRVKFSLSNKIYNNFQYKRRYRKHSHMQSRWFVDIN